MTSQKPAAIPGAQTPLLFAPMAKLNKARPTPSINAVNAIAAPSPPGIKNPNIITGIKRKLMMAIVFTCDIVNLYFPVAAGFLGSVRRCCFNGVVFLSFLYCLCNGMACPFSCSFISGFTLSFAICEGIKLKVVSCLCVNEIPDLLNSCFLIPFVV